MKIAIVGDPHIATGFRARVDDYLRTVLNKIKFIADENDAVIFLGDVFDTSAMPTYVFNATYQALSKYKGKLHTILGNHDMFHRNLSSLNRTTIGSLDLTEAITVHIKPFKIGNCEFIPVMTDDLYENIPVDDNTRVLLCHKYFDMMVCPEESLDEKELRDLGYKWVFMGHDHQPYDPMDFGSTIVYRPGSLTRTTVDMYNKDRKIRYYQIDTKEDTVTEKEVICLPSDQVYLQGSFDKLETSNNRIKTDIKDLSKLLSKFDKKQLSKLSLEEVLRNQLKATEEQILYLRELHRMHNIKYN